MNWGDMEPEFSGNDHCDDDDDDDDDRYSSISIQNKTIPTVFTMCLIMF